MARFVLIFALISFLFLSCNEDKEISSSSTTVSLTYGDISTKKADGRAIIDFTVAIPLKALDAYRTVTLKCTGGKFLGSDKDTEKLVTILEGESSKIIYWQVPDKGGDYFISATIGTGAKTYKDEEKIPLQDVSKDFSLDPPKTELDADGKTAVKITAKVNKDVPESFKIVTFKCTGGTFYGEKETTKQVKIDEKGEASLLWIVPNQASLNVISATIGSGNDLQRKEMEIIAKAIKSSFSIKLKDKDSKLADANQILEIEISDAKNIPNDKLQITSSKGTVIPGANSILKDGSIKLVDGRGLASIQIGQTVEPYFIKIQTESGEIFQNDTFTPTRAFGETIFADATLQSNNDIQIVTYLKRAVGKVSVGTPVNFRAYQIINNVEKSVGVFQNLKNAFTDADEKTGIITLKFSDDINKLIPIFISVTSQKQDGAPLVIDKPISLNYPK